MSAAKKKSHPAESAPRPLLEDDALFPASWVRTGVPGAVEVKELPPDAAWAEWDAAVAAQAATQPAPLPKAARPDEVHDDFADTNLLDHGFPPTDIAPLE